MAKFTATAIFPFLMVTLLAIGTVELGYYCLERFILDQAMVPSEEPQVRALPADRQQQTEKVLPGKEEVDYSVITRRNLFGTPPTSTVAEAAPVEEDIEATTLDIVLMGTIDTDEGDGGRAIILNKKDRSQEIYQVGDMVEGASVKEIQRGRVILSIDGRSELLDISEARQYAQNTSPAPNRAAALRRAPVVRPQPASQPQAPRVVRPLRRIVRPQAAIAADQAERENLELIDDNVQEPDDESGIEDEAIDEESTEIDEQNEAGEESDAAEQDNEEPVIQ